MQRSTLVFVQVVAAALVVVGTALVAVGYQARAGYDCETKYAYDPVRVSADEVDGRVVAFENLTDGQQEAFLDGRSVEDGGELHATERPPSVVRYRGDYYEVLVVVNGCDDPPGTLLTLVGGPLAVVGVLGFLPSFAVDRLRDFEG